jgi:hypothetical protein
MIFPLLLFAVLFAPGNTFVFSSLGMFLVPHKKPKWDLPATFLVLWIIWTCIGIFMSEHHGISFYGSMGRQQGWVVWLICARLAYVYWGAFEDLEPVYIWSTIFSFIFLAFVIGMLAS